MAKQKKEEKSKKRFILVSDTLEYVGGRNGNRIYLSDIVNSLNIYQIVQGEVVETEDDTKILIKDILYSVDYDCEFKTEKQAREKIQEINQQSIYVLIKEVQKLNDWKTTLMKNFKNINI